MALALRDATETGKAKRRDYSAFDPAEETADASNIEHTD
jgi:hypothetical protein